MKQLDELAARRAALIERARRDREHVAAAAAPFAAKIRWTVAGVGRVRQLLRSRWWVMIPAAVASFAKLRGSAGFAGRAVAAYELWRGLRGVYRAIFSGRKGR